MTRYITDFRRLMPRMGLSEYFTPEGGPMTALDEVFAAIRENHPAEVDNCNYITAGGVFRCIKIDLDEGTCRDVTEDVLDAYLKHCRAERGVGPWWLEGDTDPRPALDDREDAA